MNIIVYTVQLSKRFGSFTALDDLTVSVEEAEIFSLLGPNGAGKTATMKLLTTLLKPSSGDAFINGISIRKNPLR